MFPFAFKELTEFILDAADIKLIPPISERAIVL